VSARRSINVAGVSHKAPIPGGARIGNLFFSSGINGKDPQTHKAPEHIGDEVKFAFQNMVTVLEEAGAGVADVGLMTVFLKHREDKKYVDEQWELMFPDPDDRPARHALKSEGPQRVQLQVIAVIPEGDRS
jgi:2-iminobutanoate/2-iminopropanoate deaminase